MNSLNKWMHAHPYKAVLFAVTFAVLATSATFREDWFWTMVGIYAFVLVIWCITYAVDCAKMVLSALCLALLMPAKAAGPPPPQQSEFAGKAIGITVICVGGYCLYKMVKLCDRLFPKEKKSTNAPPSLIGTYHEDEYGASWNYNNPGSCGPDEWESLNITRGYLSNEVYIATLSVAVGSSGDVTTSISASRERDGQRTQTFEEFQREVASHGLVITGTGDGSKYYSKNRVPCDEDMVPIRFDEATMTVVHRGGDPEMMRTITVERSTDFSTWVPFVTIGAGFDSGFQVQDLTRYGQMFYRVKVTQL